jgi:hypothetical protein
LSRAMKNKRGSPLSVVTIGTAVFRLSGTNAAIVKRQQ